MTIVRYLHVYGNSREARFFHPRAATNHRLDQSVYYLIKLFNLYNDFQSFFVTIFTL